MDSSTQAFLAQPGAFQFLDMVRPYVLEGMTLEQACAKVEANWLTLFNRVSDGLHREDSRFTPAAQAIKVSLADQLWDVVNGVAA